MIRHCDGTDPHLLNGEGQPGCACGQRFDDVHFHVIWPHRHIPSRRERAASIVANADAILAELYAAYPGLDWGAWMDEQRTAATGP